jgi:hypothetical protein
MVAAAVGGAYFSERQIFDAVSPINRNASWFRNEVAREREHIEQERLAKRSAPTPSRSHDLVNELPRTQQGFDSLVAEAAKCEREFSDAEVLAAGFDVATFRDRLATAVTQKILRRGYSVGSISCDCSGPGGVCVCR